MAWTEYQLVFKLLSPLHVGYRKIGNLHQTRVYVPGKVLWGALTARLTHMIEDTKSEKMYVVIGNAIAKHFRFGYLWPSLDGGKSVYYPWENINEFYFMLLSSYVSTPLNYASYSAEEGLLHEVEYIAPRTRKNQIVYLKSTLWVQEEGLPEYVLNWKDALRYVQLGGERNYGWGRVELTMELKGKEVSFPEIHVNSTERLPAHAYVFADKRMVTSVKGSIEPVLGWQLRLNNWELSHPEICFVPGSKVNENVTFEVTSFGILKKKYPKN